MSENQTHTLDEQSAHLIGQLAALKRELAEWKKKWADLARSAPKDIGDLERQLAEARDEIARLNQSLKSASTLYDAAKEQRDKLAERIESLRALCTTDHESKAAFIDRVNAILYPQNTPDQPPP